MLDSQYKEQRYQRQKREGQYKTPFSSCSEKRQRTSPQFSSILSGQSYIDFKSYDL